MLPNEGRGKRPEHEERMLRMRTHAQWLHDSAQRLLAGGGVAECEQAARVLEQAAVNVRALRGLLEEHVRWQVRHFPEQARKPGGG